MTRLPVGDTVSKGETGTPTGTPDDALDGLVTLVAVSSELVVVVVERTGALAADAAVAGAEGLWSSYRKC